MQIFAGGLIGGIWFIFIGMFLRGMAEGGYKSVIIRQSLAGVSAQEVMIGDVISVPPSLPLDQLLSQYFLRYGYRGFPVVQADKVLGFISVRQLGDIADDRRRATTVEEIMQPITEQMIIAPETPLSEALKRMNQGTIGHLLIMQNNTLQGMITKSGLLRFLEIKRILDR